MHLANESPVTFLSSDAGVLLDVSPPAKDIQLSVAHSDALFLCKLLHLLHLLILSASVETKKEKVNGANKFTYTAGVTDGTGSVVGYVLGDGYEVKSDGAYNASLCIAVIPDFVNSKNYKVYDFAVGTDLTIMGGKCVQEWDSFFTSSYVCCTVTKSGLYYPIARSSHYDNNNNNNSDSASSTIKASFMAIFVILILLF